MSKIVFKLGQVSKSDLDHNLTELDAFSSAERSFFSHNDWCAHLTRYAAIHGRILKLAKDLGPLKILDLGCGRLNQLRFLARNRTPKESILQYTAVDLRAREEWCEECTWDVPGVLELYRSDFIQEPMATFGEENFDVVICTEAFEHVPLVCQPVLIERMSKWLRAGGTAFLSTPNAGVSESTAENHVGADGVRERTLDDKKTMVQPFFTIEECYGTFCGVTRLPKLHEEHEAFRQMKKFLPSYLYSCVIAAAYPELSNNAFMTLVKK